MVQKRIGDKFIAEIVDTIKDSDKKQEIMDYIEETCKKCADLCNVGENLRVFNEFKILIDNIIKKLEL